MAPSKMASLVIQRLPRPSHALIWRHVLGLTSVPVSRSNSFKLYLNSSRASRFFSSETESGSSTSPPESQSATSQPEQTETAAPPSPTPEEIASAMMERHKDTVIERSQLLDANQLQKLAITLGHKTLAPGDAQDMTKAPPAQGTPIPPGYHLVYFTPTELESELGADGTDQPFAPPAPFTRRMWAGGSVRWFPGNPLRIGDTATERTRLVSVVAKTGSEGKPMLIADVEKTFSTDSGPAIQERRNWVFLEGSGTTLNTRRGSVGWKANTRYKVGSPTKVKNIVRQQDKRTCRVFQLSAKTLFRFSALTFNTHLIHYNETWSIGVEGHKRPVVHGPLNLINMLDYWRSKHNQGGKLEPMELSYRAILPIYVGEKFTMWIEEGVAGSDTQPAAASEEDGMVYKILVNKRKQTPKSVEDLVCMKGQIRAVPVGSKSADQD